MDADANAISARVKRRPGRRSIDRAERLTSSACCRRSNIAATSSPRRPCPLPCRRAIAPRTAFRARTSQPARRSAGRAAGGLGGFAGRHRRGGPDRRDGGRRPAWAGRRGMPRRYWFHVWPAGTLLAALSARYLAPHTCIALSAARRATWRTRPPRRRRLQSISTGPSNLLPQATVVRPGTRNAGCEHASAAARPQSTAELPPGLVASRVLPPYSPAILRGQFFHASYPDRPGRYRRHPADRVRAVEQSPRDPLARGRRSVRVAGG